MSRAWRWFVSTKRSSPHVTFSKSTTWSRHTTEQMIFSFSLRSHPEFIRPNSCNAYLKWSLHCVIFTRMIIALCDFHFNFMVFSSCVKINICQNSHRWLLLLQLWIIQETHNYLLDIVSSCFQNTDSQSDSEQWHLSNDSKHQQSRGGGWSDPGGSERSCVGQIWLVLKAT